MNMQRSLFAVLLLVITLSYTADAQLIRSLDGSHNNLEFTSFGAVNQPVRIMTSLDYSNGISSPAGWNRANARTISNHLFSAISSPVDQYGLTNMVWVFGKFIEQDMSYFEQDSDDKMYINIPRCDPFFDPNCSRDIVLSMNRIKAIDGTGRSRENPRNVANSSTSWIDASMIYGCDEKTADWLRTGVDGKLKVSEGNLLPFNTTTGELNGPADPDAPAAQTIHPGPERYFVAGNPRVNDNLAILSMHTLFVREHNRLCDELIRESPGYSDEAIYQKARSMVAGLIQSITYNEWLPALGVDLGFYRGYNYFTEPGLSNEFITAGFRIWNTLMPEVYELTDDFCQPHRLGNLSYREMMYNPQFLLKTNIDPLLKGLLNNRQQNMDAEVIDEIRNFDYRTAGIQIKSDLVLTEILRGRDRGLPDYNSLRQQLGLSPRSSFAELSSDVSIQNALKEVYNGDINNIDAWVGMVAEDHQTGTMMGETMHHLWADQFMRLRRGDRFFYENDPSLTRPERRQIRETTLADVIIRNSGVDFLQENVFLFDPHCLDFDIHKSHLSGRIFPNPVSDHLTIALYSRQEGPASISIFSPLGSVITESEIELTTGNNLIPRTLTGSFPPGLYVIRIIQGNSAETFKFVKAN